MVVATHDPAVAARADHELHLIDGRLADPPARSRRDPVLPFLVGVAAMSLGFYLALCPAGAGP